MQFASAVLTVLWSRSTGVRLRTDWDAGVLENRSSNRLADAIGIRSSSPTVLVRAGAELGMDDQMEETWKNRSLGVTVADVRFRSAGCPKHCMLGRGRSSRLEHRADRDTVEQCTWVAVVREARTQQSETHRQREAQLPTCLMKSNGRHGRMRD